MVTSSQWWRQLHAGQRLAGTRGQSAQRNALVDLHVVADRGGLADDDAGCMVDEEVLADRRAGVDVDAVRPWAYSDMMRGMSGTSCTYSSCAMRYTKMAKKPG